VNASKPMTTAEHFLVRGIGAVSPAGWGVLPLREALAKGEPLPLRELARPGWPRPLRVRTVPPPSPRPDFLAHARLRRTSPITQYAVAAALEALGADAARVSSGSMRLGIVVCVMTGCVNYSRRFYDETLSDPATASPLVFPETVFNAPASHLGALLGTAAVNYTLVGDPGTFLQGLALAADWLSSGRAEGCVVVGAEEIDWLSADACRLFERRIILSEGAGAVYLRPLDRPVEKGNHRETPARSHASTATGMDLPAPVIAGSGPKPPAVQLHSITEPQLFLQRQSRAQAAKRMRAQLPAGQPEHLLCDGTQGLRGVDADEQEPWRDWPGSRVSPKRILGEGLAAASAWQCVAALDAVFQRQHPAATVSVVGSNEQAIGAHFVVRD
jgi:3-oxoacyl-(acyl-carrier-protein) synthase